LDVLHDNGRIAQAVCRLQEAGILVSLFLDPDPAQIAAAAKMEVDAVELHTGPYAHASVPSALPAAQHKELQRLRVAGREVIDAGMRLHAGHGLNYVNTIPVAQIPGLAEVNIGHSIVSRAVMVGMREAVSQMRQILDKALLLPHHAS
jgi:pyridoxine 5-phosphate synthase